ncbi:Hypothetical predicted protein [Lecanosticta acicola]|uniref:Uncharacterized protein n=1 Tax=Lecanosticta acicola TaxID=111012 RepID=A0AAI8Z8S4_9PEZI|nr:Hypothetical predicted protein [Lecanosticta acicola]
MDSAAHLTQKLLAERARNRQQHQQQQQDPPPPYSESDNDADPDSDDEEDEEEGEDYESPMKLVINATNTIKGSNNLVPTNNPSPLADASKFSTLLLHAIKQIDAANAADSTKPNRGLKVDLTINCGITVIGDRNVVGNVGLKPKGASAGSASASASTAVVAGAKRKAEDGVPSEAEPAVKKVSMGEDDHA